MQGVTARLFETMLVCSFAAFGRIAAAQPAAPIPPGTGAQADAGQHFTLGVAAFRRGDFGVAAEEFDRAHAIAPHYDASWNAAQAWEREQDLARAANRYRDYLRESPLDAPDRSKAEAALTRLFPRLARIEIHAPESFRIEIDGERTLALSVYVYPGMHEIVATGGEQAQQNHLVVKAGDVQSVLFAETEPHLRLDRDTPPGNRPPTDFAQHPHGSVGGGGLSPWFAVVGGTCTLVALGFTAWSGVDTLSARDEFLAHPNQTTLDQGRSRELRTNVAIGITAGLGAVTLVTSLFFVQWRSPVGVAEAKLTPTAAVLALNY
jgi:hypothetical protein